MEKWLSVETSSDGLMKGRLQDYESMSRKGKRS
jgi:hypothetical protein